MEAGTSIQPPQRKGNQPVERSRCRKVATAIVLPHILEGVCITANLLGCMEKLWYSDYDVADIKKFHEFSNKFYLDNVFTGPFIDPILQPKQWGIELANTRILNLLDTPHFGRGYDVNNCIKQLMAVTNRGYLWVEEPISLDVELIAFIIGFPYQGESPRQFHDDKKKDKVLEEDMKKTYDTKIGSCRIIIKCISDVATRLATKLMTCKFLRKCPKEEFHDGFVVVTT
jgi:hypothetical protein